MSRRDDDHLARAIAGCRRDQRPQVAIAAVAAHLREHGPLPGCQHIFEQLIGLNAAFPGITLAEFIAAGVVAVTTEGSA